MGFLIKKSDKNAFNKVEYIKNATFWKDLLAFYDAYTLITSRSKSALPDFCFENNRLSLDGICLLIQDSTAMFSFASLDPSIDYLKLLYFSMANYSRNGELPPRSLIAGDYNKYKIACRSAVEKSKELVQEELNNQTTTNRVEVKKKNVEDLKKKVKSGTLKFFIAIILACVGAVFYLFADKIISLQPTIKTTISAIILAFAVLFLILALSQLLKYGKLYKTEKAYSGNVIKQVDKTTLNVNKGKTVIHKLLSENYEYRNNLSKNIRDKSAIDFLKCLNEIKHYQDLYKNKTIFELSEMHRADARMIVQDLSKKNPPFSEIYQKITQKNWLYYNQLVRYKFITEFSKNAISTHNWFVKQGDEKLMPFEVDVKALINEKVCFLPERSTEVYCLSIEDIVKSSLLKNSNILNFSAVTSTKDFRFNKMQYMTKFYNLEKFEKKDKGIYKMRIDEIGEGLDMNSLQRYSRIPTLFEMEEKLQNLTLNLENSSEKTINNTLAQIYGNMLGYDDDYIESVLPENNIEAENLLTSDNELDDIVEINSHTAVCSFGSTKVVGYKIEN